MRFEMKNMTGADYETVFPAQINRAMLSPNVFKMGKILIRQMVGQVGEYSENGG